MVAGAMSRSAHRLAGGADPARVWPGGAGTEGPPPDHGSLFTLAESGLDLDGGWLHSN